MDVQKPTKSLYDATAGEIALKNFLVGFSRGLGGLFVTLATWGIIYFISMNYLLPQLSGFLTEAKSMIQSAEKLQQGAANLMTPKVQNTSPGSDAGTLDRRPHDHS